MKMEGDSSSSENYFNSDSDSYPSVINLNSQRLDTKGFEEELHNIIETDPDHVEEIELMKVKHNVIGAIPKNLNNFVNLKQLNISNNRLNNLPDVFKHLQLKSLIVNCNYLTNDSLPKEFTASKSLRELSFTANMLTEFPTQILVFKNLKYLYLGSNKIRSIPRSISKLTSLQLFHIHNNLVENIPESIARLQHLKSMRLNKNKIKTLPRDIVTLQNLYVLSLKDNPLVDRFISDMTHQPASLLELSARSLKLHNIPVNEGDVPSTLVNYLQTAHRCVNPNCKGVFFDRRIEHVKFVDFCGKYRVPLMQYLCSSRCISGEQEDLVNHLQRNAEMMRKVLLG